MKKYNKFISRFLCSCLILIIIFSVTSIAFANTMDVTETSEFIQENRLQFLGVSFIFTFFGIGCCWMGEKLGGLKLLLRFRGIKTVGTLSRLDRGVYQNQRSYHCFMLYKTEDGEMIESEWPVLHQGLLLRNKIGKNYTVYYNPTNPKEYDCSLFVSDKLFGIFTFLIGSLLIIGAIVLLLIVLFK